MYRWLIAWAVLGGCTSADPAVPVDADPPVKARPAVIGGERPAPVVAPGRVDPGEALPAIVLLHGFGFTADLEELLFQLRGRIETSRFLLVLPEGTEDANGDQFWDAAAECCGAAGPDVDDVAYLTGLIDALREGWDVSTVALVGHSNGGYMAYRMACDAPAHVDRIVVLAGSEPVEPPDCTSGAPTALLHLHGTDDDVVPYPPATAPFATPGAEVSVARQAARNGCDTTTRSLGAADLVAGVDGAESEGLAYEGCDAPTALWAAHGERHVFLSATERFRDGVTAFALGGPPAFDD